MSVAQFDPTLTPAENLPRTRERLLPIPPEGVGGFSQCWYPMCMSEEVGVGEVMGLDFLDGRVIVFRGEDGVAQVLSAYCPHMGADLCCGTVEGNEVVCAFHLWHYDRGGKCTKNFVGDPIPKAASLFKFPTEERYGMIWAFNGEEPLYPLFSFEKPDDELIFKVQFHRYIPADPPHLDCNAFDIQHVIALHELDFDQATQYDAVEWSDFRVHFPVIAHQRGTNMPVDWTIIVSGTNVVVNEGPMNNKWSGTISTHGIKSPGVSRTYFIACVEKGDGTEEGDKAAQEHLHMVSEFQRIETEKDSRIIDFIRFNSGTLTKSDRMFSRAIEHFKAFPRAHPSAEFIT